MDRSTKPGDDFYHYANGDWINRTEIPPDSGYVAVGGWLNDNSTELTRKQTAGLIEEAIKANAPAGSDSEERESQRTRRSTSAKGSPSCTRQFGLRPQASHA